MCIVCSPRMRKDATKLYAKRQISCEFTVSQCSPLPNKKETSPFFTRGVVIQKRRIKKKSNQKMKTHFLIIVSLSVFHMGQTMPQNRNNPNNRPGSRENPVGGFRPLTSANNRNEAGK